MNKVKSIISFLLCISILTTSCVSVKNVYDGPEEIMPLTAQELDSELIIEKKKSPSKENPLAVFKASKKRKYRAKTRKKRTTVKGADKDSWYVVLGVSAISLGVMCLYYGFCEEEVDPYGNNNNNNNNNNINEERKPLYGSSKADAIVFLSSASLAFLSYKHVEMEDRESSVYVETGYKEFTNSIPIRNSKIEVVLNNKRKALSTGKDGELEVNLTRDLGLKYFKNNVPVNFNFKYQDKLFKNSFEFTPGQWLPEHARINTQNSVLKLTPNVHSKIFKTVSLDEEFLITNSKNNFSEVLYGEKKLWLHQNNYNSIYKVENFKVENSGILKTGLESSLIAEELIINEENQNQKLEGNEKVKISFKIRNKSENTLYKVEGVVLEKNNLEGIKFDKKLDLGNLKPYEEKVIDFEIIGNENIVNGKAEFEIYIQDINNNSTEIIFNFQTEKYLLPKIQFHKSSEPRIKKTSDYVLVEVDIQLKNINDDLLRDINLNVEPLDLNVYTSIDKFFIKKLQPNEVHNINLQFIIEDKIKDRKLDFRLNASESTGRFSSKKNISISLK